MPPSTGIRDRLTLKPPETSKVAASMDFVRSSVISLGESLESLPECRERSLALTKLEEASFWAIAAIARNQDVISPEPGPAR